MHGAVDGRAARGEGCRQGFARHANAWQGARACDASAHCAEVGYQRPKDLWRSMRAHCNPQTGNLRCSERSRHAAQLPQFGAQAVMGRDLGRFNYRSIKGDGIRSAGLTLMQVGQPISAGLFGQTAQMLIASLMPRMHCTVMEAPCDVTQHALIIQRYGEFCRQLRDIHFFYRCDASTSRADTSCIIAVGAQAGNLRACLATFATVWTCRWRCRPMAREYQMLGFSKVLISLSFCVLDAIARRMPSAFSITASPKAYSWCCQFREVGYQRPKDLWRSMRAHCNPQTGNLRCSERSRHAAQLPQFGAQAVMGRDLGRFNHRSIKGDGMRCQAGWPRGVRPRRQGVNPVQSNLRSCTP
ncbi:hypothetical protein ACK3TF_000792 [Chlorella vulgaris]